MADIKAEYLACPIRQVISRFGDKWSMLVLFMLNKSETGVLRFIKEANGSPGNGAEEMSVLLDLNHTLWWKCVWSNVRVENDSTITAYKLVKGWGPTRAVR